VAVGSDGMRVLRAALYSADADAALTAVQAHGVTGCLQLVGDVLLLAVDRQAAGSDPLAAVCVQALRTRGWDGDEELADALDAATGAAAPPELAALNVDLEELADLLEGGPESAGGRIDLTTGEVWPEFALEDGWDGDPDDLDDEDRWHHVWPTGSRDAYQDMVDFTATRTNPRLVEHLQIALDGRGAFRRFKNVLSDWPEDREDWFAFSEDRRRGRARAWLADAGYRPSTRRPPLRVVPAPPES